MFNIIYWFIIRNLKFEIADLKAEKEYFQNKCHKIEKGNSELQSTSKVFQFKSLGCKHYKLIKLIINNCNLVVFC